MAVPSLVVHPVERDIPRMHRPYPLAASSGCLSQNGQSGEVVLTMDSYASGVECSVGVLTDVVFFSKHGPSVCHMLRCVGRS